MTEGAPGPPGSTSEVRASPADPFVSTAFPPLPHGVHWGLERPRALLDSLGNPHLRYPALHVGGTNGKGSVASLWASVLRTSGLRVGLYTSPHLCSFRERIQIDGRPIRDEEVEEGTRKLADLVERHRPSFFEASTALAFEYFAEKHVDVAVVEVGLGGRLDATNVVHPLVTAVTNIAMDHAEYLGDTLDAIAREKAGIVKTGVPLVTAEQNPELRDILAGVCVDRSAPFHWIDVERDLEDVEVAPDHTAATVSTEAWGRIRVRVPLLGRHQAVNAALAVVSLGLLPDELRPSREAVVSGAAGVRWPGRVQVAREGGRTWVFDVAHNTAGVHALAEAIPRLELGRPLVVLVGILGDKDWRAMLPSLFDLADHVILTQPPSATEERRWDPFEAARVVGGDRELEIVTNFKAAMERAAERTAGGSVVVTGSCHTVGDAMIVLGIEPFGTESALPLSDALA